MPDVSGRPAVSADFATIPEVDPPVMSPDGERVAFLVKAVTGRPDRDLRIAPAGRNGAGRSVRVNLRAETAPAWRPDSLAVAVVEQTTTGYALSTVDVDSGATSQVPLPGAARGAAKLVWLPDAVVALLRVAAEPFDDIGQLWVVDVDSGSARPLTDSMSDLANVAAAPDGSRLAVVIADPDPTSASTLGLVDASTGAMVRTLCGRARTPTSRDQTLAFSPDGRQVLFSYGDLSRGHRPAVVPVDGGEVRTLRCAGSGTVLRAEWRPDGQRVLAQVFDKTTSVLVEEGLATGRVRKLCDVGGGYPRLSGSAQTERIAYVSGGSDAAPDVWVRDDHGARRITDLGPHLRGLRLGSVEDVSWTSSFDGERIHGLAVLPPDGIAGPTRTVVNVHGGPHYHWSRGWLGSWIEWAQLLASNGFAVLLPNPRGSTGRDWTYAHAIRGRIGSLPLQDVVDGVDHVVGQGIADPGRLGIGGWSYGGFLTAWAISQTDRFQAAVVGAGITDMYSFIGSSGMGRTWRAFFPDADYPRRDGFDPHSPMTHLDGCRTPTLVVHGEQDRKISVDQARMLHRGLDDLGVPTDLLTLPDEGHVIGSTEARLRLLDAMLAWFQLYLPARPSDADRTDAVTRTGARR